MSRHPVARQMKFIFSHKPFQKPFDMQPLSMQMRSYYSQYNESAYTGKEHLVSYI